MTIQFPRLLLREKSHSWNLVGTAAAPGETSANVATLVRSDGGGFWSCTMTDVSLSGGRVGDTGRARQRNSTLLWRAVRQICGGGVTAIVVPRNDALFRPWPAGLAQSAANIDHGDGSPFDDNYGYYQSVIDITAASASLRATSIDITINYAGQLLGGESFSIQHATMDWRLYEIATVAQTDSTHATITFNPPLREAIANGTTLEFDRPRCKMRLAQPSSMELSVVPWTFNTASASFIEAP